MKITKHAEERMNERINLNDKHSMNKTFKNVMTYGKNISYYEGEFKVFLLTKKLKNCDLKVYNSYIWIYSKGIFGNKLITTYPVPDLYNTDLIKHKPKVRSGRLQEINRDKQLLEAHLIKITTITSYLNDDILEGAYETYKSCIEDKILKLEREYRKLK